MQLSFATIAAFTALMSFSAAHLIMTEPKQWDGALEPQAPLAPDGSDFPCGGATPNETPAATYTAGSTAQLSIIGTAAHGGGSGQMVMTYDYPPTANSVWRVLQSWEGDHPFKVEGNFVDPAGAQMKHPPIDFAVPAELPSGKGVIAWLWWNRVGNREMYMKCSTVQIEGKTSSAGNPNDDADFCSLPTMFRANSGDGCTVPANVDAIAFKNPGKNVVKVPGYTATPIDCDASQPGSGNGGDNSSPAPSSSEDVPAPSATSDVPVPSATSDAPVPTATYSDAPAPTATGYPGGDEESGSGDGDSEVPEVPVAPSSAPAPTATSSSAPSIPKPTGTKPSPADPSESSGSCPEGKVYCNDDNTWSMCGSGYIQKIGQIPEGMQCINGEFAAKGGSKRAVRFSPEHMRRRHH